MDPALQATHLGMNLGNLQTPNVNVAGFPQAQDGGYSSAFSQAGLMQSGLAAWQPMIQGSTPQGTMQQGMDISTYLLLQQLQQLQQTAFAAQLAGATGASATSGMAPMFGSPVNWAGIAGASALGSLGFMGGLGGIGGMGTTAAVGTTGTMGATEAPTVSSERLKGKVWIWNEDKGFGFVEPEGGGEHVFVHRSNLADGDMLVPGTEVEYELEFNAQKGKTQGKHIVGATSNRPGAFGKASVGAVGASSGVVGAPQQQIQGTPLMQQLMQQPQHQRGGGSTDVRSGKVKTWFQEKECGFVSLDSGEDCFVDIKVMPDRRVPALGSKMSLAVEWDGARRRFKAVCVLEAAKAEEPHAGEVVPGNGEGSPGDGALGKGGGTGMVLGGSSVGGKGSTPY